VAGSKALITYIKYASRPYMFSTAPFVSASAAALKAIQIIEEDTNLRTQLWRNITYIREELLGMGFNIGDAQTAIFPLIIGDDYKVKQMAYLLHEENIFVNSVPYPAVPRKITRVRLSVTAGHTERQLSIAMEAVRKIGKKLGII
jgi:glycine C-acetyltransferase